MTSPAAVRIEHVTSVGTRQKLSGGEIRRLGGMAAFVAFLHVLGWGTLWLVSNTSEHRLADGQLFGLGLGVTVYALGMRHAFDADHLAAIDNTTRKLMTDGQRPVSVGFWFSLGHSSVVFVLCALLTLGIRSLTSQLQADDSTLHQITGVVGPTISGLFLAMIAVLNLVILVGILKIFREMRRGDFDEAALEEQLNKRGFMNRILSRFTKAITKPWQMYPLGFLFGLGFDTATEVGLLAMAGSAATIALPWYAVLCLPVIFAAGMSLWDTIDGTFMNFAYGWAFSNPVRKIYYNITLTSISVAFAIVIGGTELLQVAIDQFGLAGGGWDWIGGLDLNTAGFVITGVLLAIWVGSVALWKFGRIEARWSASLQKADV
jgi:high-affinity nickel-transport protein